MIFHQSFQKRIKPLALRQWRHLELDLRSNNVRSLWNAIIAYMEKQIRGLASTKIKRIFLGGPFFPLLPLGVSGPLNLVAMEIAVHILRPRL